MWKRVESLRAAGVDVQARPGAGYALSAPLALLDADAIVAGLAPAARAELAGLALLFETDSTNAVALREPAPARGARPGWPSARPRGAAGAAGAGRRRWPRTFT